jgi:hypothetical protein
MWKSIRNLLFAFQRQTTYLLSLPLELRLEIATYLDQLNDLNSLLRTTRRLYTLLTPTFFRRAVHASALPHNRSLLHYAPAHGRQRLVEQLLSPCRRRSGLHQPARRLRVNAAMIGGGLRKSGGGINTSCGRSGPGRP